MVGMYICESPPYDTYGLYVYEKTAYIYCIFLLLRLKHENCISLCMTNKLNLFEKCPTM